MPIRIGSRLGSHEITSLLGKGGMGEVYRARDSRLKRDVAIKILPEEFASDADRVSRFQREAEVLASLNHPNIAAIHNIEESEGTRYLVLELVEGETLADRIARGPIPLDEALEIAKHIAEALEAAHERGIIHRDLKPANVKISAEHTVKVLDFGLAKPLLEGQTHGLSNSPTLVSQSVPGVILGTAAYMSPEQAKGRPTDRISDVWAFGCVLYEMLTGTPAFDGETISEILAGTLRGEPDWTRLPAETTQQIRRMLRRCLEKSAKQRMQSMGDIRLEIEEAQKQPQLDVFGAVPALNRGPRSRFAWITLSAFAGVVTLLLIIIAVLAWPLWRSPAPLRVVRFELSPPADNRFVANPSPRFALSPDGQYVVFPARSNAGREQLWLRRLDSTEAKPIPGTESTAGNFSPQQPFWSPDSKYIGFFVTSTVNGVGAEGNSKLKTVDVQGGPVETLYEFPKNAATGAWNSEGTILVGGIGTLGLMRLPAKGGVPVQVTKTEKDEESHLFPHFLPDGRHFIYLAFGNNPGSSAIYIGSLDSSDRRMLLHSDYMAEFARPNLLLFVRGESLLAQIMDLKKFTLVGEPSLITKGLVANNNGRAGFSVSNAGVLVYGLGNILGAVRQFVSIDRAGKMEPFGNPTYSEILRVAPDGKRIAYSEGLPSPPKVWVYDIERGVRIRVTNGEGRDDAPVWSPDGSQLLFHRTGSSENGFFIVPANAASAEKLVLPEEPGTEPAPDDWSADGRFVIFRKRNKNTQAVDLWVWPVSGGGKPFPYLVSTTTKGRAVFSPNGRWVAYVSNEADDQQIFVQPFPDPSGGKLKVSNQGGTIPRWRRDGKELYYIDAAANIIAVSVNSSDKDFTIGSATIISQIGLPGAVPPNPGGRNSPFDAATDGQHFIMSGRLTATQSSPLIVTLNWNGASN